MNDCSVNCVIFKWIIAAAKNNEKVGERVNYLKKLDLLTII